MQLTSLKFADGEIVPQMYTCKGPNINPPFHIDGIPPQTQSLALTIMDKDASPKPWVHWFVFNIPPATQDIAEGTIPSGATEGHANGGTPGYEGPCPIYFKGTHHYVFTVYALSKVLDAPNTSTYWDLQEMIEINLIEKAELVGIAEGTGEALASSQ